MADEIRTTVCTRIEEKRQALSSPFLGHTIFRVPRQLYAVNKKAYEPEIISIGPYHRGKNHLKMMEEHKVRFLTMLLRRTSGHTVEPYVAALRGMVEEARNYYSESLGISTEDFLEMLVLDGCFIVEFIYQRFVRNTDEYILKSDLILIGVLRDLILFENQLPFFVLWELFGMMGEYERNSYVQRLLLLFCDNMPGLRVDVTYDDTSIRSVKHLLDLVRGNWLPSEGGLVNYRQAPKDGKWSFIRSATELKEAGIRFKKGEGNSLFDIMFRNGVLEIPSIRIADRTESLYRNVIVCEQFEKRSPRYFVDFAKVMDCLINSAKDVELLCHCGIIDNWLGDDETVATMFNRLADNVFLSSKDYFFYARLCNDVNEHYNAPWNKRMASLKHNYFNTPWALISFLAAAFLLLLTLLQTTFTIFPRN